MSYTTLQPATAEPKENTSKNSFRGTGYPVGEKFNMAHNNPTGRPTNEQTGSQTTSSAASDARPPGSIEVKGPAVGSVVIAKLDITGQVKVVAPSVTENRQPSDTTPTSYTTNTTNAAPGPPIRIGSALQTVVALEMKADGLQVG